MASTRSLLSTVSLSAAIMSGCALLPGDDAVDCVSDTQCSDFFGPGSVCSPSGVCSEATGENALQVGMLYVGPVGDKGWTLTHDESRAYFLNELDDVTAMFAPSVSASDAPARIEEFVARGDNVIIGTSFDFLVPMQTAALKYPDLEFLLVNSFRTGPNLGSYSGRMYQVLYQAGFLAGRMTKTGIVGSVGSVTIPETVSHTNAFAQGVFAANPDAKVMIRWVGAWFDPPEETAATEELLAAGADVILSQTDTTVPIETGNAASTPENPVFTIGYDNRDNCKFAPETCLTSAYWNWGPMLTGVLREIQNGTWNPETYIWEQMKADPTESAVYLAPISETLVPSAIRIEVEGLVDDLSEDTVEARMMPFRGPISDPSGTLRVGSGAYPSDDDVLKMCWYVRGIIDTAGNPAEVPQGCGGEY